MLIKNMEMDLKYIAAHSGGIFTRDLFTQPYPFLNVFFNYLGYWLFFCTPFLEKKKQNCDSNENSNYNYNK